MTTLWQDLRFAIRQMRRAPGFAVVAIATLALAIGCATAVFSVIDATLIRPLPYNDPDRIVDEWAHTPQGWTQPASRPDYLDLRRLNKSFTALAGYESASANLESSSGAAPVHVMYGTDGFFDVFAVKPLLGRTFLPGEDQPGHNDVAVLSYDLWQRTFGGRRDVLGSRVRIDGVPNTIVGVMPAGFRFPLNIVEALYRPIHVPPSNVNTRGSHFLPLIGRLKPGVTMAAAQVDLQRIFENLNATYHSDADGYHLVLRKLNDAILGNTGPGLRMLGFAVLGILLIGCVNIAGLLLARGVSRQRELSLRSAVGASRSRIARQILTETALLSLAGAAMGVVLAAVLLQAIRQLLIQSLDRGADIHLNLPILAMAVVAALLCALAAGSLPALRLSRVSPSQALRSGGAAGTSRAQQRLRGVFIGVQVALALCLLGCSGLLLRELNHLRGSDFGFSPQNLISTELYVSPGADGNTKLVANFYRPLLERVRAIPGVQSVAVINLVPIETSGSNSSVTIVGKPTPKQEVWAENRVITPGTLQTIGARLLSGRDLSDSLDRTNTPLVAVVNQTFVRRFFAPGEDPLGRQISWGEAKLPIVGVFTDLQQNLFGPAMPEMDLSVAQVPAEYAVETLSRMHLIVRTAVPPDSLVPQLRRALHDTDATVPFRTPETMDDILGEVLTLEHLESWLFGIFAGLALTLSLVGLYGTITHEVELRTRDIGVRMALGSTRTRVAAAILQRVALLLLAGVTAGWLLMLALRKVLAAVVTLHPERDGWLLAGVTLVLALCGIAAAIWPALRAASIEPTEALRAE